MALIVDNVIATQVKFIELFSIEFVKFFFKNTMMLLWLPYANHVIIHVKHV